MLTLKFMLINQSVSLISHKTLPIQQFKWLIGKNRAWRVYCLI